jgi:hypothetical protein
MSQDVETFSTKLNKNRKKKSFSIATKREGENL